MAAEDLLARMDAPEPCEQRFVERLHAHRDAVDTGVAQQFRLVGGDGRGIALHGPFARAGEAEPVHRPEHGLPLLEREQRGRAAAEEDRVRPAIRRDQLQLAHQRGDVAVDDIARRRRGVEGAVLALVRAERHMDVQAAHRSSGRRDSRGSGHGGRARAEDDGGRDRPGSEGDIHTQAAQPTGPRPRSNAPSRRARCGRAPPPGRRAANRSEPRGCSSGASGSC